MSEDTPKRININLTEKQYQELEALAAIKTPRMSRRAARMMENKPYLSNYSFYFPIGGNRALRELVVQDDGLDPLTNVHALSGGVAGPTNQVSVGVFGEDATPDRIAVVSGVAGDLVRRILKSRGDIHRLTPQQFEELIMDRLAAMRYDVRQVGKTTQPDGGVDIVFWPREGFPILGAVQVKHHAKPELKSGVEVVHSMAGVLERHRHEFNLGMVVTNTSFTSEAEWFVKPMQLYLRLRDGDDVMRWIDCDFADEREQREFPTSLQLTSKLILDLKRKK